MSSLFFLLFSVLVSFGIGTTHSQVTASDNGGGPAISAAAPAPSDNGGGPAVTTIDNGGGPAI